MMTVEEHVTAAFERHRRFVWGLGYRMTGSVFDADEIVQETFLRVLEKGPAGDADTWRPWLARVATNAAIDALRRRRREPYYTGPWLPAPIETGDQASPDLPDALVSDHGRAAARYDEVESISYAFLLCEPSTGFRQR